MKKMGNIVVGMVLIVAFASPLWAADKVVVGLSVAKTFEFMPPHIGQELGIWQKRGLEVETVAFRGDADLQQAIVGGSVQIGLASGVGAASVNSKGVPVKIVYAISNNPGFMVIIAGKDSGINTAQDLKGKTIGVTRHGALTDWIVKRMAMEMGWDPEKGIVRVPLGGFREQVAALKTGQSDGFVWSADGGFQIEEEGLGKTLLSIGEYVKHFVFECIEAPTAYIEKNPDVVKRFLQGWAETTDWMKQNKEETINMIVKYLEVSPMVARKTYELDMKNMSSTGEVDEQALQAVTESLIDLKIVKKPSPLKEIYTTQFTPVKY